MCVMCLDETPVNLLNVPIKFIIRLMDGEKSVNLDRVTKRTWFEFNDRFECAVTYEYWDGYHYVEDLIVWKLKK